MNKWQWIILVAMAIALIGLPLAGYSVLDFDVILPLVILAIAFVAFGKRKSN